MGHRAAPYGRMPTRPVIRNRMGNMQNIPFEQHSKADQDIELVAKTIRFFETVLAYFVLIQRHIRKFDYSRAEPVPPNPVITLQESSTFQS